MLKASTFTSLIILSSLSYAYATTTITSTACKKINNGDILQCKIGSLSPNYPTNYGINNIPYALCSRALCTILPGKKMSVCICDLENYKNQWQALSLSPTDYQKSKPVYDKNGKLSTIQSNYSMANISDFNQPLNVTCNYKTPHYWANCYGARCVVIHQGHGTVKNAVTCACPVFSDTTFMIGSPSVSYCGPQNGKIWSGIKNVGKSNPMVPLYQQLYPTSPPVSLLKN